MTKNINQILAIFLCFFILFSIFSICLSTTKLAREEFGWKFVILGDTQDLAAHQPNLFFNATNWISNQPDIIYVTHMGDLVDNRDNLTQWQTAYDAMHILDGHAEWGTVPGNHDLQAMAINGTGSAVEDPTTYNSFFGDCEHYNIVKNRFIFIYIRFDQLDYAETVIQAHPKLYAIIVTHSYLHGSFFDVSFQKRIAKYDNVIAVLCGHHTGSTLLRYSDGQGDIDSLILTDYQDIPITNALKVCTVYQDRIDVETFEPMSNSYRNGSTGFLEKFSFPYGKDLNLGYINNGKLFANTDHRIVDLKIADLTSDLGNEVVVAGGTDNVISVFNSSSGKIAQVYHELAYSLEILDFNNDGKLEIICGGKDLIVYDGHLNPIEILLSNRNSSRPVMIKVADVDKDENPELLTMDVNNESLTHFRVWESNLKILDVWAEENMPANLYESKTFNVTRMEPTFFPNGTMIIEEVIVEETINYENVWPTSPKVVDLNGDGKNEVYVDVPCDYIVEFDDNYTYKDFHGNWGIDFCIDENGNGQFDVYGSKTQVLNLYPVSPLGSFYVGGTPMNMVGYDLDADGDSEILWTDLEGNICIFDEGRMLSINNKISNATFYTGSLMDNGAVDIFAATNGSIYIFEDFRKAYFSNELQNQNNEYWFGNQPNIFSVNATLVEINFKPAEWYSVNTKFRAKLDVQEEERAQIKIDVGELGKPARASIAEWGINETSGIVTYNIQGTDNILTIYWTDITDRELMLILPYIAVAVFTSIWIYQAFRVSKKKKIKAPTKNVAIGFSITTTSILLLLILNFII